MSPLKQQVPSYNTGSAEEEHPKVRIVEQYGKPSTLEFSHAKNTKIKLNENYYLYYIKYIQNMCAYVHIMHNSAGYKLSKIFRNQNV